MSEASISLYNMTPRKYLAQLRLLSIQVYSTLAAQHATTSDVLPPALSACTSQMFRARRRDMPALPATIADIDLGQVGEEYTSLLQFG